jgi:hypothetical protein
MIQLKLLAGFAVRRSRFSSQAQIERLCMRNLLASTEERVFFKDLDSRFVLLSAGVLKFAGQYRSLDEVLGKTDADFFSEPHAVAALDDERRVI